MTLLTKAWMRQLTETPGPPGDESQVRDFIARSIHGYVDALRVDALGNLIAKKQGTGASPLKAAVSAHMDEVALFVTDIDKSGFLHVARSGGVNPRTVLGKTVQVGPDRLPGVICAPPVHFTSASERRQMPDVDDLVIDIGAADKDAAKAKIKIGQRVLFQTSFQLMGLGVDVDDDAPLPAQGRVSGKAFDDRMGCALLCELLTGDPFPFDLTAVFTVQEEIGLRGALAAGFGVAPDVAFILEGTVCDDLPGPFGGEKRFPTTKLGDGPALTQRDRSHIVHPPLLQHLLRVAAERNIPYQFKQPNVGGTDAAGFARHLAPPIAILSVPCRYIHGPVAVAELSDLHNGLALLRAALPGLDQVPGVIARQAAGAAS